MRCHENLPELCVNREDDVAVQRSACQRAAQPRAGDVPPPREPLQYEAIKAMFDRLTRRSDMGARRDEML